jgi:hypothetical protein
MQLGNVWRQWTKWCIHSDISDDGGRCRMHSDNGGSGACIMTIGKGAACIATIGEGAAYNWGRCCMHDDN